MNLYDLWNDPNRKADRSGPPEQYDGKRIRFVEHGGPDPAPLTPGDTGTVNGVDDAGTLSVRWDSGEAGNLPERQSGNHRGKHMTYLQPRDKGDYRCFSGKLGKVSRSPSLMNWAEQTGSTAESIPAESIST